LSFLLSVDVARRRGRFGFMAAPFGLNLIADMAERHCRFGRMALPL